MTEIEELVTIHIALSQRDPKMLTSPDGKRIEVSLDAVRDLVYGRKLIKPSENRDD